jgi:hypothetical protein
MPLRNSNTGNAFGDIGDRPKFKKGDRVEKEFSYGKKYEYEISTGAVSLVNKYSLPNGR